jgi:hypothetical protein
LEISPTALLMATAFTHGYGRRLEYARACLR